MTLYDLPDVWSPVKFAVRYGLDSELDFYVDAKRKLVVFSVLPDDPPIFEPPDPPEPTEKEWLEQRLTKIEADIIDLKAR